VRVCLSPLRAARVSPPPPLAAPRGPPPAPSPRPEILSGGCLLPGYQQPPSLSTTTTSKPLNDNNLQASQRQQPPSLSTTKTAHKRRVLRSRPSSPAQDGARCCIRLSCAKAPASPGSRTGARTCAQFTMSSSASSTRSSTLHAPPPSAAHLTFHAPATFGLCEARRRRARLRLGLPSGRGYGGARRPAAARRGAGRARAHPRGTVPDKRAPVVAAGHHELVARAHEALHRPQRAVSVAGSERRAAGGGWRVAGGGMAARGLSRGRRAVRTASLMSVCSFACPMYLRKTENYARRRQSRSDPATNGSNALSELRALNANEGASGRRHRLRGAGAGAHRGERDAACPLSTREGGAPLCEDSLHGAVAVRKQRAAARRPAVHARPPPVLASTATRARRPVLDPWTGGMRRSWRLAGLRAGTACVRPWGSADCPPPPFSY